MRVLVDTNIVLDVLLRREPFVQDARALWQRIEFRQIEGFVAATTLTNIFYIVRRQTGCIERANKAVSETLTAMEVCPVDRNILVDAMALKFEDFEDAVQVACAITLNANAIITRDKNFAGATLLILSAGQLLKRLS